jgi:four helix bundle protein
MRPHEKLTLWQRAVEFVLRLYRLTQSFSKEEKFGLTSQIRRAAVSVPANIAEGAGRQSNKEFLHFLSIAQGSASELATELIIAHRLGYINITEYNEVNQDLDEIGRMIVGLARQVRNKNPAKTS